MPVSLWTKFRGKLFIKIKGLDETTVDNSLKSMDEPYLWTSLETAVIALTRDIVSDFQDTLDDWKIINFSRKEGVLEVEKVA